MDLNSIAFTISTWALPMLLAITLHEAAHGYAAYKLGDPTAKRLGRVTINPIRHVDPFGTVFMPALLLLLSGGKMMFGYAKPVPVIFANLNKPKRDMVFVAAAGPAANFFIACLSAKAFLLLPYLDGDMQNWVGLNLENSLRINCILMIFNLIPLLPLDGGRILTGLLPLPLARKFAMTEKYGMFALLFLLFALPYIGDLVGIRADFLWQMVSYLTQHTMLFVTDFVGLNISGG